MICWTIQHKRVIDVLNEEGSYYPNFAMSPQTHRPTYDQLLGVFNQLNKTDYKGLIFCFAKDPRSNDSFVFDSATELFAYMKARPGVLSAINNGKSSFVPI